MVVNDASILASMLTKKKNAINYHVTIEAVVAPILRVGKEVNTTKLVFYKTISGEHVLGIMFE